jgi:hypothetical protein
MNPVFSWLVVVGAGCVMLAAYCVLVFLVGQAMRMLDREPQETQPRIYRGTALLK